jgi:hypothetical protein
MSVPVRATMAGLDAACAEGLTVVEWAITAAMEEAGLGMLEELQDLTLKAGLGGRLPSTWKLRVYPRNGYSLEPAAFVYSKAPRILSFFTVSRVITPQGEAFAIPVNPVIKRGGAAMTPVEVEARFNAELEPRRLASGNIGLFLDLVAARNRRRPGFRPATAKRLASGRQAEKTLMFVLVRSLRSKMLIDLVALAERWSARLPGLVEKWFGRKQ